jgi:methionyl-tRNA formyltransferase
LTETAWRIVFFGTPSFSTPSLEGLLRGRDQVVAVVTQPDREKGRGRRVVPSPVKETALRHGVALLQPERVKEEAFHESMRSLDPDLFVVVAYGRILPGSLLRIPRYGAVNVHASLLPFYRGASPIAWAILRGEEKTGVTTMLLDEGMDTGGVLLQREALIGERETAETLHDRLAPLGAGLLVETLERMKAGTIVPTPQNSSEATYAPPLSKENGKIDWALEASEIDRQVRAFYPWPGAFTGWEGRLLKVSKGRVRDEAVGDEPGRIVWVASDFIEVATGRGRFLMEEVQEEGKRKMSVKDFLSGHAIHVGAFFR